VNGGNPLHRCPGSVYRMGQRQSQEWASKASQTAYCCIQQKQQRSLLLLHRSSRKRCAAEAASNVPSGRIDTSRRQAEHPMKGSAGRRWLQQQIWCCQTVLVSLYKQSTQLYSVGKFQVGSSLEPLDTNNSRTLSSLSSQQQQLRQIQTATGAQTGRVAPVIV
jgi:hypothetical protein